MRTIDLHNADGVVLKIPGIGVLIQVITAQSSVPSDGADGYGKGCFLLDTANGKVYVNEGSVTSASFKAIASLTAAQEAVLDLLSAGELGVLDGVTAGTVAASKAVVADASKNASIFNILSGVDIRAGASGTAGTVTVFPETAANGSFIIGCAAQGGARDISLSPEAMAQPTGITIPDPGAAVATLTPSVDIAPGTGISTGTGTKCEHQTVRKGSIIKTEILLDLTGLNSGDGVNDIIGKAATANCHIGQVKAATHGTIFAGRISCLETPAGGDPDVDLWYADEATGTEDVDIAGLTGETQIIDHGDWAENEADSLSAFPAANKYLYLACGAATDATYTAGIFLIELWGTV